MKSGSRIWELETCNLFSLKGWQVTHKYQSLDMRERTWEVFLDDRCWSECDSEGLDWWLKLFQEKKDRWRDVREKLQAWFGDYEVESRDNRSHDFFLFLESIWASERHRAKRTRAKTRSCSQFRKNITLVFSIWVERKPSLTTSCAVRTHKEMLAFVLLPSNLCYLLQTWPSWPLERLNIPTITSTVKHHK